MDTYTSNADYSTIYGHDSPNLEENKKIIINRKKRIKYNFKLVISIIIFIITTAGFVMNENGIIDFSDSSGLSTDYEFNITNFIISNDTCKNFSKISDKEIDRYFRKINEYQIIRAINFYLILFSFICSFILFLTIYHINRNFLLGKNQSKFLNIFSFVICLLLLINEFLSLLLYLALFLRMYEIIVFIESGVELKCIIILTWHYTIKLLKLRLNIILILSVFKICNLQLIIYFMKQLLILNHFFNFNYEVNNVEDNNSEKEKEVLKERYYNL